MNPTSVSFLPEQMSPVLSARLAELAHHMQAPLLGILTDEQRALSLAIARRLVISVAEQIDPAISGDRLWADWLEDGLPVNAEWAASCFARGEEYRLRAISEGKDFAPSSGLSHAALHGDRAELAEAYLQLQIADRCRFNSFGYPILTISDISDDLYRHLLNEIARWRLREISRDRLSSAGLGEAVRSAWKHKVQAQGLDFRAHKYYDLLVAADRLYDEANHAVLRQDWPAFIALAAAVQARSYAAMALLLISASMAELAAALAPLHLTSAALTALEASLAAVPFRAVRPEKYI